MAASAIAPRRMVRALGFGASLLGCVAALIAGITCIAGYATDYGFAGGQLGNSLFGLDALSGFFAIIIALVGAAASIYSAPYAEEYEKKGYSSRRFAILFNAFILSMLLVVGAQNAVAFLIFWEAMALSSYFLVTFETRETAAEQAGFVYLLITHVGTAFLIVMFLLLAAGAGGSIDFSAFAAAKYAPVFCDAIFVLALVGFGTKAGVMPLHIWLPLAHPRAPSNVSALMSGVMLKIAIYGLVRVLFGFLGVAAGGAALWWGLVLLVLGAISSVMGVLYSLLEHDLKRLLAMHSIENIGIIFLGLGAAVLFSWANLPGLAALALFAALYHTLNHAIFKSLLFLGAGAIGYATHTYDVDELGGLIKKMPVTAVLFLIGAVSIAAIPPLNGFASEWMTFHALISGVGLGKVVMFSTAIAFVVLALTSALALAAFTKAFGVPFLGAPRSEHATRAKEVPSAMLLGMGMLAAACVVAGILPGLVAFSLTPALKSLGFGNSLANVDGAVASLPTGEIFAFLLATTIVVLLFLRILKSSARGAYTTGPTWDCGIPQANGRMQYSAKGFSMPIVRVFNWALDPLHKAESYGGKLFDAVLYQPLVRLFLWVSPWSMALQTGKLRHYVMYLMATLVCVLALAIM